MKIDNPYNPGEIWQSRESFTAICADGTKTTIKPKAKIILLSSVLIEGKESIKFFYKKKIYYATDIDVAHYFNFLEEFNKNMF